MNIKALLAAATALVACMPAPGWGNPIQLNSPGAAQVYGDGAASAATARSAATAAAIASPMITTSPAAAATGGTATINITRGGGGGHSNGASRGAGAGTPSAAGTPLNAGAGTGGGAGTGAGVGDPTGSGRGTTLNAPPGFGLPAFGGGQCATVGFGIAISPSGGGAFGPAWESTNCGKREMAKMIASWGDVAVARYLLRTSFPEVEAAYQASAVQSAAVAVPAHPEYCAPGRGWTAKQLAVRYPECH